MPSKPRIKKGNDIMTAEQKAEVKAKYDAYDGSTELNLARDELYCRLKAVGRSHADIFKILFPDKIVPTDPSEAAYEINKKFSDGITAKRIKFLRKFYFETVVQEGIMDTKTKRELLCSFAMDEKVKISDRIKSMELDAKLEGTINQMPSVDSISKLLNELRSE